jgi:hypothetical protein
MHVCDGSVRKIGVNMVMRKSGEIKNKKVSEKKKKKNPKKSKRKEIRLEWAVDGSIMPLK